jgi:hypothetical protein
MWKYFYNFSGQIAMPDFYVPDPGEPMWVVFLRDRASGSDSAGHIRGMRELE